MELMNIIIELEKKLPEEYLDAPFIHIPPIKPFKEFLETDFINFINEQSDVDRLVEFVLNSLPFTKVTLSSGKSIIVAKSNISKVQYIENFIKENNINDIDILDILVSKIPFMDKDFMITIGDGKKSIEAFYNTILNNQNLKPTLKDNQEICSYYIEKAIDEDESLDLGVANLEVLKSNLDDTGISVGLYIMKNLSTSLINGTDIPVGILNRFGYENPSLSATVPINEAIKCIIDYKRKILLKEREDLYNRTSENPGLVGELQIILDSEKLEVTSPIPIVMSDEERKSMDNLLDNFMLFSNYEEEYTYYLNKIMDQIRKTNDMRTLELHIRDFQKIKEEALVKVTNLGIIKELCNSIESMLDKKKMELIKFDGNKSGYIDASQESIEILRMRVKAANTMEEYAIINGDINKLASDIYDNGITDNTLLAALEELMDYYRSQRMRSAIKISEYDMEKNRAIANINDLFSNIRREAENIFYIDARDIRTNNRTMNVKIEQIEMALRNYHETKLISDTDFNNYSSDLKRIIHNYGAELDNQKVKAQRRLTSLIELLQDQQRRKSQFSEATDIWKIEVEMDQTVKTIYRALDQYYNSEILNDQEYNDYMQELNSLIVRYNGNTGHGYR